ncbi:hypothetical protein KJ786_03900 [Patescibacteria group bacterium]|nr:hypothetical protein [Patescibacteria group bacterium]
MSYVIVGIGILALFIIIWVLVFFHLTKKEHEANKIREQANHLLREIASGNAEAWWNYLGLLEKNKQLENYGFTLDQAWVARMSLCQKTLKIEKMSPELRKAVFNGP